MARIKLLSILVLLFSISVQLQQVQAQSEVTIGTGTSTTSFIPVNRYYDYSACEAIYLSSEVGQAGEIAKIRYYKGNSDDASSISATKIYMKTTSSSTLAYGAYSLTGYTLVFDGTVTNSSGAGWKEIVLQNAFSYDNQQNLSILILHGFQSYTSNYPLWRYSTTSSARCRYEYSDIQLPTTLTATTGRPNIQLVLNCYRPTANAGSDVSICNGSNTAIGGSPTASGGSGSGYTYNWSPSTGLSSTTVANPTASPTSNTTYYLTVTDGASCVSYTDSVKVNVSSTGQTYLANNNNTYKVESGNYYDSGGPSGSYSYNEHYTQTFYPCGTNQAVKAVFSQFDVEYSSTCSYDYLKIYNGPNTSSPLLHYYCGTGDAGTSISTHATGALTFEFVSDGSVTGAGFAAALSTVCLNKPTASAGSDKSICNTDTVAIGGSPSASGGSGSGYTYSWTPSTGLSSTTTANPTTTTTISTTYSLVVTDGAGCKSDTSKTTVYVSGASTTYIANSSMTHYVTGGTYYDGGGATGDYYNNKDVTQTFYPCNANKKLKFTFTSFDLEQQGNCNNDYLSVYDGPSTASTLIGKYCGAGSLGPFTSTHASGALTFKFHSDASSTASGWAANITELCISNPIANAGTDVIICPSANTVIGGNPSASGGSGSGYTYSWSPATGLSSTTIANPTATPSTTTSYTLTVTDGSGCVSTGDLVKVEISDSNSIYKAVANATYEIAGGKFYDSGGTTGDYSYNEHKIITFKPCEEYKRVRTHFNLIDLEYQTDCDYDWMKVYDGPDTLAPLIVKFCGYSTNYEVVATNPEGALTFEFYSDYILTYDGWNADLIIECQPPKANAGPNTSVAAAGEEITLGGNPTASGGSQSGYTYNWSPATGLSSTTEANPTLTVTEETHYYLTVTDGSNCVSAQDSIYIYIADTAQEYRATKDGKYYVNGGRFYDSGGSTGDYNYDEDNVTTFYPCEKLKSVKLKFNYLDLEYDASCQYDWIRIYNGPDTSSALIGTYCGNDSIGEILSTHSTGSLTVLFHSDYSITGSGWDVNISINVNCNIVDSSIVSIWEGNGCDSYVTSFLVIIDKGNNTLQWQQSFDDTNYTDIPGLNDLMVLGRRANTKTYYRAYVDIDQTRCYTKSLAFLTGSNYYVNDNSLVGDRLCTAIGNNNNDGMSISTPKSSIQEIINSYNLKSCDTIFVDLGNYNENIELTYADSGGIAGNIVILGTKKDSVIISNSTSDLDNIKFNGTQKVKVKNLTIESTGNSRYNLLVNKSSGCVLESCILTNSNNSNIYIYGEDGAGNGADSNSVISNAIINTATNGNGFEIFGKSNKNFIAGNSINTSGASSPKAIIIDSLSGKTPAGSLIMNNNITTSFGGIFINNINDLLYQTIISENILNISQNGTGISILSSGDSITLKNNKIIGGDYGIKTDGTNSMLNIFNNSISNSANGISFAGIVNSGKLIFNSFYNSNTCLNFSSNATNNWNVINNIFYVNGSSNLNATIIVQDNSQFEDIDYNLYYFPGGAVCSGYNNSTYALLSDWKTIDHKLNTGYGDEHSIYGDPQYINPTNSRLEAGNGSSAVEAGIAINGYEYDFYLFGRTQPPSVGAFGCQVASSTGQSYYVNDNSLQNDIWCKATGDSLNDGNSPGSPKQSINEIFNHYTLSHGDVIYVDAGTYNEVINISGNNKGNSASNFKIIGAGHNLTTLNAPQGENNFNLSATEYLQIQNMTLQNTNTDKYNFYIDSSHHNLIESCVLVNSGQNKFYIKEDFTRKGTNATNSYFIIK